MANRLRGPGQQPETRNTVGTAPRIDSLEGARTWAGQGIFTSNLVKIATLTAPVPLISTTGGAAVNRSSSIPTPRARTKQRKDSRETDGHSRPVGDDMTTAGPAGEREVPFGPFDLPRCGRPAPLR